jgi:molecular chaperone GrpE
MPDQPFGRSDNTGDGDNYDPDVHDPDTSAESGESAAPADGSVGQGIGDDAAERSSEVDDSTAALADAANEIDLSEVDVLAVLDERNQFKDIAQRVQADFENFRKQSAIRAQADSDRATGRLAEALLPVLDAAEAAFLRHPDEVGPLLNQMLLELKKHGLETLDLHGAPFDPEVAEAVAHEAAGGGEPIVAEVLRSGYRWKGKTLRAAMVKTTD